MNIDVNELEVMEDIASLAVVTGEKKEKYLFWQLEISMAHAKRIDLIVSFLMESGVKMLLPQLKQAQKRGVPIRILTGNYLGIALALLVFGVYCIWNDAYMNLNQKPWSVHLLFGVLALCNFGIAENNQRIGVLFADGKLGFGAVNLVFAVMFVVFEIVFLIKRSREKRDLSEEKAE